MTKHGPVELNHREGTKATPGMTEVYFGPDDGCPVAHVQGPDRGEIGARIVACVNACEGMDDPEAEITRLQTIVDVLEGEDPIPRRLWEIRQSWPTSTLNFRGRRPEDAVALTSAQEDALRMADGMIARVFVEVCGGVRQDSPHCPSNILRRHFPGVLAALGGER